MKTRTVRKRTRDGFLLLELMVALLILATVLLTIAGMTLQVSKKSVAIAGDAYRNGVLIQEINRLQAMPYTALTVGVTTTTVTTQPYPHTRTVTITQPKAQVLNIKLIVTPTRVGYRPDTVTITRRYPISNTFDTQAQ